MVGIHNKNDFTFLLSFVIEDTTQRVATRLSKTAIAAEQVTHELLLQTTTKLTDKLVVVTFEDMLRNNPSPTSRRKLRTYLNWKSPSGATTFPASRSTARYPLLAFVFDNTTQLRYPKRGTESRPPVTPILDPSATTPSTAGASVTST